MKQLYMALALAVASMSAFAEESDWPTVEVRSSVFESKLVPTAKGLVKMRTAKLPGPVFVFKTNKPDCDIYVEIENGEAGVGSKKCGSASWQQSGHLVRGKNIKPSKEPIYIAFDGAGNGISSSQEKLSAHYHVPYSSWGR